MNIPKDNDKQRKYSELSQKILSLAKESILIRFRFFEAALSRLQFEEVHDINGIRTELKKSGDEKLHCIVKFSPVFLLNMYHEEPNYAARLLLHLVMHVLFLQYGRDNIKNRMYWDIASDIAVENAILSLDLQGFTLKKDAKERAILAKLSKWISQLSAEKIYREFMVGGISEDSQEEYGRIFSYDIHPFSETADEQKEQITISYKDFEEIARKLSQELKAFSKDVSGKEVLLLNLKEGAKKHFDYDEILRIFATSNEEIKVNPDEFDYIYYTYGLNLYKNMPLIEPLEYTQENKIREFVIAIDTSASVRGDAVESFLRRTYDILAKSVSFSEKLLVHLLQCDNAITDDVVIHSADELKQYAGKFKVKGFGATDFRPVFTYVDELIDKKLFTNLQGLIYFTDGYGIYPEKPTRYDTMFVFEGFDDFRPEPPNWAIMVVLEKNID